MGTQSNRRLIMYLPLVAAVTLLVAIMPVLLVWWLRASGLMTSFWAGAALGVTVALVTSYAGGAFWKTRTGSRDILFSELLLWGWLARWRNDRRLSAAADVLGLASARPQAVTDGRLTNEQKAGLLTQLSTSLEARDPYTHGHSRRVARHATNVAKRMGVASDQVAKIRAAAAMHDVGKLETPTAVLHKEAKLTDEEFAVIKRHPVDGAVMVATLEDDELTAMVRHHHERIDGTGYPDGLAGKAIPLGARIIAVADTFDAITSTRAYRRAHAHKKALDILEAEAGSQLDPGAVRAFCACYSGRRPLALWTAASSGAPKLASWLGGGLSTANAGSAAGLVATAAAAVGGAALGPAVVETPASPDRAVATAAAPRAPIDRQRAQPTRERKANRALRRAAREDRDRRSGRDLPRASAAVPRQTPAPPASYGPGDGTGAGAPAALPTPAPTPPPVAGGAEPEGGRGDDRGAGDDRGSGKGPAKDRSKSPGKDRDRGNRKSPGKDRDRGNRKGPGTGKGPGTERRPGDDRGRGDRQDQANRERQNRDNEQGAGNGQGPSRRPGREVGPGIPPGHDHGKRPGATPSPPPRAKYRTEGSTSPISSGERRFQLPANSAPGRPARRRPPRAG